MAPHDLLKPNDIVDTDDTSDTSICSSLVSSQDSSRQDRKVHFDDQCLEHVREYIGLQDYTEKEHHKCWYSPEDKLKNEHRRFKVLVRMEEGKACKPNMTYRGLDYLTTRGEILLDQTISACVDAVMDEQEQQWENGIDDYDKIAEISSNATIQAKQNALQVALQDEQDAKLAYLEFKDSVDELDDNIDADNSSVGQFSVEDSPKAHQRRKRHNNSGSGQKRSSSKRGGERHHQQRGIYKKSSSKQVSTKKRDPEGQRAACIMVIQEET